MKSILRATALLSSSSIVSILVGLISAKAWAILLGPSGLGTMGLLQALVGLGGLLAGTGLGAGVVRLMANALGHADDERAAALRRAAWLICGTLGSLALLVMIIFRVPISRWMLGDPRYAGDVVLMGLALIFSLASGLQVSILNGYHRIAALAQYGVANSLVATAASLLLVWQWREQGIAPAVILNAAVGLAIAWWLMRREVPAAAAPPSRAALLLATRDLLRFALPYTASLLVGAGVQQALPAVVLNSLGSAEVGYYRAAIALSVTYLGFLLNAMALDFYPRAAAASDQPAALVELLNQQHRLMLLLAGPMILAALSLAPFLIPLIYSPAFAPAVDVLEWQLAGDLLRISSWTLGYVVLARGRNLVIFLVELVVGATILASTWAGMRLFGVAGTGIGFLFTYVVHYCLVYVIVRRDIGLVWSWSNKLLLGGALTAALLVRGLPAVGLLAWRTPVALALAIVAGLGSLYLLWREMVRDQVAAPADPSPSAGEA